MRSRLVALAALTCGCQPALDTEHTPEPFDSFGEAIYREGCQRLAYTGQLALHDAGVIRQVDVSGALGHSVCIDGQTAPADAPPKLIAMPGQRLAVIRMVDATLPQPFLATLQTFLERIGPLYDDGTMEQAIVKIADTLETFRSEPEVADALASLGQRHGYRPAVVAPGLMHALVEYRGLDEFIGSFLGLIGPGGAAEAEWHTLLTAGSITLRTAMPEVDPASNERTLKLALDLMLATNDDVGRGASYPAVARDARGVARLDGAVAAPFADVNGDTLPDVDSQGRFVDANGAPLIVATPFPEPGSTDSAPRDSAGRALTGPDATAKLYHYFDLDNTVLAGALREAPALLDPGKDTALGLVWSAQPLLGARVMASRTYARADGTTTSLSYKGFDSAQSPLLDLLHSFVQLLGAPNIDSVLKSAATLLQDPYESQSSRAVAAMLDTSDRGKQHVEAQIAPTSTLFDDLIPLVVRVLRVPGLAQDLLTALQDPHVKGLAPMIARLMTAKNQVDFNHTKAAIGAARGAPNYDIVDNLDSIVPVDRTRPDTDRVGDYNRSLMQRIAHLVHDANNAPFCNKANARVELLNRTIPGVCDLFQIDDLALFFALNLASDAVRMDKSRMETTYSKASFREQIKDSVVKSSVADNAFGDTSLQNLVGVTGFRRFPSPKALGRALFLRPGDEGISQFLLGTTDPIQCKDRDLFIDVHDKSVFAWELTLPDNPSGFPADTFFEAVRPLVDAFAKHDECASYDASQRCVVDAQSHNAVKIFVDLFAMLHEHWASPQSTNFEHAYQSTDRAQPRFAFPDNVVSFEPLIAEVLRDSDLVPSLIDLAPVLSSFTIDGKPESQPALPVLLEAMRYVFDAGVTPASLAYRNGSTSTVQGDGRTPVPRATPFHLLADAFLGKRAALAALSSTPEGATQADKWRSATSLLVDELLTVDRVGDTRRFRNRILHGVTQQLIKFVRDRIGQHTADGDVDAWVHHDLTADVTDKLTGPVAAALGDLVARLEHDDAARDQFYGLLNFLLDEPGNGPVFRTVLTTLADQAQQLLDDHNLVPIAHALGAISDPTKGIVDAEITMVKRSHDLDADHALLTVLRNLYQPGSDGVHPASILADIVSELNRTEPGHGGDLEARDEQSLLEEVRGFLTDNQRGFMRFVKIVQNRSAK